MKLCISEMATNKYEDLQKEIKSLESELSMLYIRRDAIMEKEIEIEKKKNDTNLPQDLSKKSGNAEKQTQKSESESVSVQASKNPAKQAKFEEDKEIVNIDHDEFMLLNFAAEVAKIKRKRNLVVDTDGNVRIHAEKYETKDSIWRQIIEINDNLTKLKIKATVLIKLIKGDLEMISRILKKNQDKNPIALLKQI